MACFVVVLPARSTAVTVTLARSRLPLRIARFSARFFFLDTFSGSLASSAAGDLARRWA